MHVTPIYGFTAPDQQTQVKDLGAELKQMAERAEQILAAFDYEGADPNLVLSRVAALEAAATPVPLHGLVQLTPPSGGGLVSTSITFPPGYFEETPAIMATLHTQAGPTITANVSIASRSKTGFTLNLNRSNATATFVNWAAFKANEL